MKATSGRRFPSLSYARLAPDDGAGSGGGAETPPAPPVPPLDADEAKRKADELAAAEAKKKELEKKIEAGEIRGMSESTAHALLEELRDVKKELKELKSKKHSSFFGF